jgi:hypothetical protein
MIYTCGVCGVELKWKGMGPRPKWCAEHRNTRAAHPGKRLADHRRFQRNKVPCPRCGEPRSAHAEVCNSCRLELVELKRAEIVKLWAAGHSIEEIARAVHTTKGSLGVQIHNMRGAGYRLPYRYKMENNVRVAG